MRIGLIIYGSLDILSGGYLYDRKLVEFLRGQKVEVEIFSLPERGYSQHLLDNFDSGLLDRLKTADIDILLQDELNHPSLFYLNRRLRPEIDYPILSIVHHLRTSEARPTWQNKLFEPVEQAYLKSVDGFIFNSHTTRQTVEKIIGPSKPSVVAQPAGDRFKMTINEDQIIDRGREPGPLRLVFVGNVIERKGLHTLLDTVGKLEPGTCYLTVVGSVDVERDYVSRIEQQIAQLGIQDRVEFTGRLDGPKLASVLRQSQLLVVPSSYEGYGIVYLEGMSFGLPSIATNAGAAEEIISYGENGFLITPGDSVSLQRIIKNLHHDRDWLIALSIGARRRFELHPGWDASMRQIYHFLLGVVEAWRLT